jgi:hypothetical protein
MLGHDDQCITKGAIPPETTKSYLHGSPCIDICQAALDILPVLRNNRVAVLPVHLHMLDICDRTSAERLLL